MPEKKELLVRTAVRALITNEEGRILILKRSNSDFCNGWWNLPGGKIDFGQTSEDAIIREIQEETQLECVSSEFLFYMDNLPTSEYNTHFLTLFFKCQCDGEVILNSESAEYHWLKPVELESFRLAFEHDSAIRKYLNTT